MAPSRLFIHLVILFAAIATWGCSQDRSDGPENDGPELFISPAVFDLGDGKSEFVEQGYLFVPENRDNPASETIGVHFMRFRSTAETPRTPIFMMAGGPGSSWIPSLTEGTDGVGDPADGDFEISLQMLSDLRSVADVVVIDQRGAGLSLPQMDCPNHQRLGTVDELFATDEVVASLQQYVRDCKRAWAVQGRDIDGYHALQLADDINDLRLLLGYQKISLYAGSFGSEWGFVTIHKHPEILERVVFRGLEGINHTYDMPSEVLTSVKAILSAAESDEDLATHVPEGGFLKAVTERIEELGRNPVTVPAEDPATGEEVEVTIGAEEFRRAWRDSVNRVGTQEWPASIIPALNGDLSDIATEVASSKGYLTARPTGNHFAMHMAIDCGLSPNAERRKKLKTDPAIALIGDINLLYFGICEEWAAPNIDNEWLDVLHTDLPALFIHGTWDLSTPLQNALEIAPGFSNGRLIVVEGGTHGVIRDLYREQPEIIRPLIRKFLRGENIDDAPEQITLDPVDFAGPATESAAAAAPE